MLTASVAALSQQPIKSVRQIVSFSGLALNCWLMTQTKTPNQLKRRTAWPKPVLHNEAKRGDKTAIRPFHVNVPEAELTELRRRINATKWPERETVTDASQGVQLATIQALARYWATDYDWRKIEAKLNALPQFRHRDRRAGHSFHPRPLET